MPRIARIVVPGIPHHITQRGNNRRQVFVTDRDYFLYFRLLREYADRFQLSIWGYCLMPNHIHLIAVPHLPDSLSRTLGRTHADFARIANIQNGTTGHFWQARYYSCPMDDGHTWSALAYIERNPIRADLTTTAASYLWSSAKAHLGGPDPSGALDTAAWQARYNPSSWLRALSALSRDQALTQRIREACRTGRPLGDDQFLRTLQTRLGRQMMPKPSGRKRNQFLQAAAAANAAQVPFGSLP